MIGQDKAEEKLIVIEVNEMVRERRNSGYMGGYLQREFGFNLRKNSVDFIFSQDGLGLENYVTNSDRFLSFMSQSPKNILGDEIDHLILDFLSVVGFRQ